MKTLPDDAVDIWYCHCDDADLAQWHEQYGTWLSPDERERYARYVFDKDRRQLLVSRALLRTVLSRYAPILPIDWRFEQTHYGKPFITAGQVDSPLQFNVSNTEHLVACAVAVTDQIGIDVECIDRRVDPSLARWCLSPSELLHYSNSAENEKQGVFYRFWTLKESYIKGRGLGLSLPLTAISFTLHETTAPTVSFAERLDDDPEHWQFYQMRPDERHFLAVSVRRPRHTEPQFKVQELPLIR